MASRPIKVLEGKPQEVERQVALWTREGWTEKSRDWCAGMLQVTLDRPPTRLDRAKAHIDDAEGLTAVQKDAICNALEALIGEDGLDEG